MDVKVKNTFQSLLFNPFVLAILPALLIYTLQPLEFGRFTYRLFEHRISSQREFFHDMNFNGATEAMLFRYDDRVSVNFPNIFFSERPFSQLLIDQVNLPMNFVENAQPVFADYDHNSLREIYVFLKKQDSLFIAGIEFSNTGRALEVFVLKFVDIVYFIEEREDFHILPAFVQDLNNDGYDEIGFVVAGLYGAKPRAFYAFDVKNNAIVKSPYAAIRYDLPVTIAKTNDSNQQMIITCNTATPINYKAPDDILSDSTGYALAFNNELDFWFEPVPNKIGFWYTVQNLAYSNSEGSGIISLFKTPNGSGEPEILRKYDLEGNLSKELKLDYDGAFSIFEHDEKPAQKFWLWDGKAQKLRKMDFNLSYLSHKRLQYGLPPVITADNYFKLDLNNDGNKEIILTHHYGKIIVYTHDFRYPLTIPIDYSILPVYAQVINFSKTEHPVLFIERGNDRWLYHYMRNPWYYLKYPYFASVYLAFALLLHLLLRYQRRTIEKRYEAEQKLLRFRFLSVKNQMDPHFTLNAINSISSMYMAGHNAEANRFLTRFSRLILRSLMDAENIETTIEEELQFVTDYLDVQNIRFKGAFTYAVNISDTELNKIVIPKQLIYTFVENALKHGLWGKKSGGLLRIDISRTSKTTAWIIVEDNGDGNNGNQVHSTGKGLKIVQEILDLFERLKGVRIQFSLTTKTGESGRREGTVVTIELPINLKQDERA